MKLQEAYNVTIDYENRFTLLFVTNDGKAKRGVYSAIVAVSQDGNDSMCVKYNYYKDINNAPDFEIYSFKLSGDLNSDKKSEIIVQGTKEFTSTYYVLELYNGKFRQILQSSVNIQ